MDNETRRGGDPGQKTPAAEGAAAADLEKQAAEGDFPKRQTKMLILPGDIDPETAEKAAIIFDKYPGLFEKAGLVKTVEKYTLPDGGTVLTTAPLQKKGDNMSDQNRKTAAGGTAPAGLERITAEGGTEKKPEPAQITDDVRRAIDSFLEEQQRAIAEVQRIVQGIDIDALQVFFDELKRLEPYMAAIMKTDRRFEGLTIDDLLSRYNLADVRNIEQGDPLFDLLEAAKEKSKEKDKTVKDSLLEKKYLPTFSGKPINEFIAMDAKDLQQNKGTNTAYIVKDGAAQFTIEQYDKLQSALSLSAKKLLYAAVIYLTDNNVFRGDPQNVNPTVIMPLIDYGKKTNNTLTPRTMDTVEEQEKENRRAKDRIRQFRKNVRNDLEALLKLGWSGEIKKGRNKGDYVGLRYISSYKVGKEDITINFDIALARFLAREYEIQGAPALLGLNSGNSFAIGMKLLNHNSNDNNHAIGTDCTLSVKKILESAPGIATIEELQDRPRNDKKRQRGRDGGQRNWKDKIKKPLEAALNDIVSIGILKKWEYRNPKNGTTYTAEGAQSLSWGEYSTLMIDWTMESTPPGQAERRAKKAAEKARAAIANETPKKKRGRPKKQEEKQKT